MSIRECPLGNKIFLSFDSRMYTYVEPSITLDMMRPLKQFAGRGIRRTASPSSARVVSPAIDVNNVSVLPTIMSFFSF